MKEWAVYSALECNGRIDPTKTEREFAGLSYDEAIEQVYDLRENGQENKAYMAVRVA